MGHLRRTLNQMPPGRDSLGVKLVPSKGADVPYRFPTHKRQKSISDETHNKRQICEFPVAQ